MSSVRQVSPLIPETLKGLGSQESQKEGFERVLKETIGRLQQIQTDAEKAIKELISGGDVVEAVVSMQKAELSFQLMVEVRNRLLNAYEEIQRMQV